MDLRKRKQPAPAESVASSGTSSPISLALRRGISSTLQALKGSGSGSGSGHGGNDINGEHEQVVVVHREVPLDSLILSLAPPFFVTDDLTNVQPPPPPPPPAPAAPARAARNVVPRNPIIPPPYPWATNLRATVHSLDYLLDNKFNTITGEVSCKKCKSSYTLEFDLLSKFLEVKDYITTFRDTMNDRATARWMHPEYPTCRACEHPGSLRPIFGKKRNINWLFLFLSQMMGGCNIAHLKYFCKHTLNHRTGAKDRLLFLTYLGVGKQLQDIEVFTYRPF